jgi:hypothetical protein
MQRKNREVQLMMEEGHCIEDAERIAKSEVPQWLRFGSMEQWQWIKVDRFRGEKRGKK